MVARLNRKTFMKVSPFILALIFMGPLLCSCETGVYHTVTKGQTLYRISRTYQVNEDYLARVNGITDPSQLRIGTRLFIPGASHVRSVPRTAGGVAKPTTPSPSVSRSTSSRSAPVQKQATVKKSAGVAATPKTLPKTSVSSAKSAVSQKLQWPLRGKIVRTFSEQSRTGGGKGIEISVRAGSNVAAADAGKVIYSGDGVRGYGFLIIVQHENDLFTVYGFNQKNLVRQGDFVSKGEKIALSGVPPGGGAPRLHFEVRKGKAAVDPLLYLP